MCRRSSTAFGSNRDPFLFRAMYAVYENPFDMVLFHIPVYMSFININITGDSLHSHDSKLVSVKVLQFFTMTCNSKMSFFHDL